MSPSALIAEDEPLLAANLKATLTRLWPELRIVASVTHGAAALEAALASRPDVIFLDIRMPGMNGLEVSEALTEDWPEDAPLPLLVFVTAYDQYALQAFEQAAVDYVLKPVDADRLALTCRRLQAALHSREQTTLAVPAQLVSTLGALRTALSAAETTIPAAPRLRVLQASRGTVIHMVPVAQVLYFEAADKYIKVVTAANEYLIRIPLRQLLQQLDPQEFWQVHRATAVRVDAIATAVRVDTGKVELTLKGRPEKLTASRLYAHLFKAM
jgi:DNA-binding LytR/AlgR family response regulator